MLTIQRFLHLIRIPNYIPAIPVLNLPIPQCSCIDQFRVFVFKLVLNGKGRWLRYLYEKLFITQMLRVVDILVRFRAIEHYYYLFIIT